MTLPSGLEADALRRKIESEGGFATILRRGDPDRGAILLVISERGQYVGCLERHWSPGGLHWVRSGPSDAGDLVKFLENRHRFDPDSWLIELDIASGERFIVEMTAST